MKTLVYSNLGEIAMNRNNYDESIDYYTQTINAAPDFFTASIRKTNSHLQLSRIYRQKKDFETAENLFGASNIPDAFGQFIEIAMLTSRIHSFIV
jgi:tetratricopeptide (TPR) repeat protein